MMITDRPLKVLVTSGGTREYVDSVRVMTNISTGKLGAQIAQHYLDAGHDVIYLCSQGSVVPKDVKLKLVTANSARDVLTHMELLVPRVDVVVMTMAISDFTFDLSKPVKLKSSDPEAFIESMRQRIMLNPKVISKVKDLNPGCVLFGFKFEVGIDHEALFEIAFESLQRNRCDIVVANDKEEMKRENAHVAYFVDPSGHEFKVVGKDEIARAIVARSESEYNQKRRGGR